MNIMFSATDWMKKGTSIDVFDPDSGLWFKGAIYKLSLGDDPMLTINYPAFEKMESGLLSKC
jgi:hypothetical protein